MDNVLSYIIVPYIRVERCLKLVEVFDELLWRGMKGRRARVDRDHFITDKKKMMKCIEWEVIDLGDCMCVCCRLGYLEAVRLLLKRVNPDDGYNTAIRRASTYGHVEVVRMLLKDGRFDPSVFNNRAIRWASTRGHVEVVRELMKDERVDPSDDGNMAIIWASEYGYVGIVKELMKDDRVDPSDRNNYAIKWAWKHGYLNTVKELQKDDRVVLDTLRL